jgi:hypothetical protein
VRKGVVTKDSGSGPVPVAGATVQVRSGGTDYSIAGLTSWGVNRFVTVNTMSDGSYTVSLPLGVTFARICAIDLGLSATTCTGTPASLNGQWTAVDNVTLNAPTTTMDFAF